MPKIQRQGVLRQTFVYNVSLCGVRQRAKNKNIHSPQHSTSVLSLIHFN